MTTWKKLNKINLLLFFLIFAELQAQQNPEVAGYLEQYPEAERIGLVNKRVVRIEIEEGELVINQKNWEEDLFLDNSASFSTRSSLSYSTFFELRKLEAATLVYNKGRYEEILVTDFKKKDELDGSFYDDNKSVSFLYPRLQKGGKTKLTYEYQIKNPRFLSTFFFADYQPMKEAVLEIWADPKVELDFATFHLDGLPIEKSVEKKKGMIVYSFSMKDIEPFESEGSAPNYRYYLPHIIPRVKAYEYKKQRIPVLEDTQDLYGWYSSLVQPVIQESADAAIEVLVKEITADKSTDLEKAKAIYYWTQKNIKYVDFEYALGGFVPRSANEVFRKKYGDCKDNSSLLFKMLEIAGMKGYLTWIGTRDLPYTYSEVPSPQVDNHMILTVEIDGKNYFLDATGRYLPMALPSSFIQGKEALIGKTPEIYEVVEVPIIPAAQNQQREETSLRLEGASILGSSQGELSGYVAVDFLYEMEDRTKEQKVQEYFNFRFRKGSNSFLSENIEVSQAEYDGPVSIGFDFKLDNYAKQIGDEIYVNLNLNRDIADLGLFKDRELSWEIDYQSQAYFHNSLDLPEGYAVDYLPENFELKNDLIECTIRYALKDGRIDYTHQYALKKILYSPAELNELGSLIKKVEPQFRQVLVLKKTQ